MQGAARSQPGGYTVTKEVGLGGTRDQTVDTRLKAQGPSLLQGHQGASHIKGWDSDNLGQATFSVWIHFDSPIRSALLDIFSCLPQRTAVPQAERPTASSIRGGQQQPAPAGLSGHMLFPHQPQGPRRDKTLNLGVRGSWGNSTARRGDVQLAQGSTVPLAHTTA